MLTMTDPKQSPWQFGYDAEGRLLSDEEPTTAEQTLERTELDNGYEVVHTSGEGRLTTYTMETLPTGDTKQTTTFPTGLQTVAESRRDGTEVVTSASGVVTESKLTADPRFRMQAPITSSRKITFPSQLESTVTTERTAVLDPNDPTRLLEQIDTVTLNGEPFSTVYTAADAQTQDPATLLTTTPEGRQTLSTLDEQGRVVRTEVPGVHPIVWEYDSQGRLSSATHGPDDPNDPDYAERRVTSFNYKTTTDNQNRLLDMLTDAENRVTSFGYDDARRVTQQTRPDSEQIGYGYDDNGNLDSLTPPGRPAHEFDYTAVNLESFYIPPQPSPTIAEPRTEFVYDKDRQLEEIRRPDGQVIDFVYGETDGRLQSVGVGSDVRVDDYYGAAEASPGELESLTGPHADLSFTYDGALLEDETWTIGAGSHTVSRTYTSDLRLNTLQVASETPVSFGYDDDGLLTAAGSLVLARDAQGQVEFMGKYGSTNIQDAIGECARQSAGGKEYVENCSKAVLGPLNPFFKLWWRTR